MAGQIWTSSPPFETGNTRVMSSVLQGALTWLWVNFQIQLDQKKQPTSLVLPMLKANIQPHILIESDWPQARGSKGLTKS